MDEIINPATEFNRFVETQYYLKNEIFGTNPTTQGLEINCEKLALFLESLQKQVLDAETKLTLCVSEDLYRQEIKERYEVARKLDLSLVDINHLREYIYYEGKSQILQKEKANFILGEIENLKMMMKRVETQQYEGLDLFRRVKKSENHIITLAKMVHQQSEKEKFLTLQVEELQNQLNELKHHIDSQQEKNETKFQEQSQRITEIETAFEEEAEEEEQSLSATRSLMRSMSFNLGDIAEEVKQRLDPPYEADEDFATEDEEGEEHIRETNQFTEGNTITHADTAYHFPSTIGSDVIDTVADIEKSETQNEAPSTLSTKKKSVTFQDLEEPLKAIQKEKTNHENRSSHPPPVTGPPPANTTGKKSVILVADRPGQFSEVTTENTNQGGLLKPLFRNDTVRPSDTQLMRMTSTVSIASTDSSTPEIHQVFGSNRPSLYQARPQKLRHGSTNHHTNHGLQRQESQLSTTKRSSRRKSNAMNMELLEFLRTQYFEKLQSMEYQSFQLQQQMKLFQTKIYHHDLSYLKKIIMIFTNAYAKQQKQYAWQRLLQHKLNHDRRRRETLIRHCTIFMNKLQLMHFQLSLRYGFYNWKRIMQRLKKGEKMKAWLKARIERWYQHIQPDVKHYLNRWKIVTIVSFRAAQFTGEEDDINAIRSENNRYFLNLRQALLDRGEFNLEALKQNALEDLKHRWNAADRKAKEEEKYQQFQQRILSYLNKYYEEKAMEDRIVINDLTNRLVEAEREGLALRKDLSRCLAQIDEMDRIFGEKTQATITKVMTLLNTYKSQYTVQLTQVKDTTAEEIQQLSQQIADIYQQLQVLFIMKTDYDTVTVITIQSHQALLESHQQELINLQQKNIQQDELMVSIQSIHSHDTKQQEKAHKLLTNHMEESHQYFSEELVWMKNLSKHIHQSLQEFKTSYEQSSLKMNKMIEMILSGESNHEQYQSLLRTVCHYYQQYEFYKLMGIQQVHLQQEIQQVLIAHQKSDPYPLHPPSSSTSIPLPAGTTLQKKLQLLQEMKEKYSQQFLHEQRQKISNELSEAARRLAFYVVVKSDNYVTAQHILQHLLKVNHSFQFDPVVENLPPVLGVTEEGMDQKKHHSRPHSASATTSRVKTSKLPPPSPERNLPPGRRSNHITDPETNTTNTGASSATMNTKQAVPTHLYTFNNENLSVESIRKQYLSKIEMELQTILAEKDAKQLQKSKQFTPTSKENISDFIAITSANLPMIKEIRNKFITQFIAVIAMTLDSFPKMPFFHGIQAFVKTSSLQHPSQQPSYPLHSMDPATGICLGCDRPLTSTWQSSPARSLQRPKSASHIISSTYHHNPFQGFLSANQQFPFTFTLHPNAAASMGMMNPQQLHTSFIPMDLQPIPSTVYHSKSTDYLPSTSLPPMESGMSDHPSVVSTSGVERTGSKQSQAPSVSHDESRPDEPIILPTASEEIIEEEDGFKRTTKLTISLQPIEEKKTNRSPSPPPRSKPTNHSIPRDRLNEEHLIRSSLSLPPGNGNSSNPPKPATESTELQASTVSIPASSLMDSYSQVEAQAMVMPVTETLPPNNPTVSYLAQATFPVLNSEILVDSLAHQFPKEVTIRAKHMESSIVESITPEISIQSRKLIGKDEYPSNL